MISALVMNIRTKTIIRKLPLPLIGQNTVVSRVRKTCSVGVEPAEALQISIVSCAHETLLYHYSRRMLNFWFVICDSNCMYADASIHTLDLFDYYLLLCSLGDVTVCSRFL